MDCVSDELVATLMNKESNFVTGYSEKSSEHEPNNHGTRVSEVGTQSDSLAKKPKRSANFSNDEDLLLVSAWLNTSLDAIHSNEQKMKRYWQRVHTFFHKNKDFISDRSSNSLMNRWSTIQQAVNKFCGFYAQIEERRQSGLTEQDKITQAKVMYLQIQEVPFSFEHCWNILRSQPKWVEAGQRKKTKKSIKSNVEKASTSTAINLEEDNTEDDSFVSMKRPLAGGKKLEKERAKNKKSKGEMETSVITIMEEIREEKKKSSAAKKHFLEQMLAIEQKKEAIEEKKEEDRIMLIDTTEMPPLQAEYYQHRQREIMEKLLERS